MGTFVVVALTGCTVTPPSPPTPPPPPPKVVIQVVPAPAPPPAPVQPVVPKVNASPWIGKTVDDVITTLGQPIGSVDMGNGTQAFQFYAKPKRPKCVASYLATRENDAKPWVVQEYIAPEPKTCL